MDLSKTGGVLKIRTFLSRALASTPLAYFPVHVRAGPAKGAKWTLAPFSSNWRTGGEGDLEPGLSRLAQPLGAVCWDFGGHYGIHTVGMAMQVGPTGQVVSFEPDPVAFRRLKYHVQQNHLENVVLYQAAVSSQGGTSNLIIAHGLGSAFSHFRYEDEPVPGSSSTVEVKTVAPDELVASGQIRAPDMIKIDVQGHGAHALRGALKSIEAKSPVIIFSSHSPWELSGARELLQPLGYSAFNLQGKAMSWEKWDVDSGLLIRAK
jgi:FkbM family methyltransferase